MNYFYTKLFCSALAVSTLTTLQAQKADATSQKVLDAVASKYKKNKNTYFKFLFSTGENGKISKNETGLFYTTPSQYRLKIMGIEQIFDGSKVYNISAEDQEVTISKADGSEMMFSPTNYLNNYKKDYNAVYQGKKTFAGAANDVVRLSPVNANGIKYVNIYINSAKKQISKIEQVGTDQSLSVITIKDYKENQAFGANTFTFNKNLYKNYIVTEL